MTAPIGPEEVRALRGSSSRATFARSVGVTPNTVYRWELPEGAKDARRPRGEELRRLQALRSGARSDALSSTAQPAELRPPRGEELADVLAALDRVYRGDWLTGRAALLRSLTQGGAPSPDGRALAAAGLALIDLFLRSDPRSALGTLAPALSQAEDGQLSAPSAALVYAAAACAHSLPDATLFDPGRVHAYAARAEELARGGSPEIAFLAWMPTVHAAVAVSDDELVARAFGRMEPAAWSDLPPLLAVHELETRALHATFSGQRALAEKLTIDLAAEAATHGFGVVEARALALMAVRKLEELHDPEKVLELARRSQHVARLARASMGAHTLFATRAEAEALLRCGRAEEAVTALDSLREYTLETGLPPILGVMTTARVDYLTGRYDALLQLAASLRSCEVPSLRAICRANAALVEAMHLWSTSVDPESIVEAFERAAALAKGWSFLLRDVLVLGSMSHILVENEARARLALRHAQRMLDRLPYPWASAYLGRVEGALAARHGRWTHGRQLLEATIATYESTGDVSDAAMAKHMLALIEQAFGAPDDRTGVDESQARLDALGLRMPPVVRAGVDRVVAERRADAKALAPGVAFDGLVVPLQRLGVRGADPGLVQRELIAVTSELLGMRPVRLEEIDAKGEARVLGGAGTPSSGFEWVEFGDGIGRRLRLGALGPLDERGHSVLSVLGTMGSLALEVATLRDAGRPRIEGAPGEDDASVPGLIALSASMRALRSEIARLAGSRATVVVYGESGTGKEVVSRAIHDLSTRSQGPYVAFNCATVPRDLFEGQLFGYRRGAFTGATKDHPGVLRAAHGGTIFLDEIGELPLDVQPKLLRFLENGEIFPLGEKRPQVVDVRVIAATHRDLAALVRQQRFREDLYYRLQVVTLRIAPLRDRMEDIAPLTRHFLRQLAAGDDAPPVLSPEALAKLTAHDWPGNVRELRNVLERALAYSPAPRVLRPEHVKLSAE
ncbi:MAG TPA: sigma 54-interacting transcriptional regulator [Polyangiaceae bacterium]